MMHLPLHHSILHYPLLFLVLGAVLLLFGRSLFWLFVAIVGFVAGTEAAPYLLPHQTEMTMLIVALVLGLIGALLAIFLQKIAIAIAGFVAGGYIGLALSAPILGVLGVRYPGAWIGFLAGGIVGAILLFVFFNWALILLSSIHGAHLVLRGFAPPDRYYMIALILLALLGVIFQASTYRRRAGAVE